MSYQPIPCDFHDRLLAAATLRKIVEVVYREGEEEHTLSARITDVYTKEKAEYVVLSEGTTIRLDRLIRVDGVEPGGSCDI